MSRRALLALALVAVAFVGCQGGASPYGIIGAVQNVTGVGPGGPTAAAGDLRGAFVDIDEPEEVELGRSVTAAVGGRYKISRDLALTKYVALVGNTVAAASDRPDMRYNFAVLDTPEINALAAPGGFVFISKGALALMPDEAALAGVLGHEIGHVALRQHADAIKTAKRKAVLMRAGEAALSFTKVGGFASLIAAGADAAVEQTLIKGFSRGDESDADKVGFQYAARAGYDPAGLREFLAALKAKSADAGVVKFNSTHPGTDERLEEQAKLMQAWKGGGKREAARFAAAMKR